MMSENIALGYMFLALLEYKDILYQMERLSGLVIYFYSILYYIILYYSSLGTLAV